MNRLFVAAVFDTASFDSVAESFDSVVVAVFDLVSFDSVFVENYPVFPAVSANRVLHGLYAV